MVRLVSIGAALVAIASPCYAQTSARVCTQADPRVGQIVEIDDNKRMQINRRGQTIIASVGDPICQNDRTLPSTADIEISLDKAKERITIPKGSIRDFTGVKPPPLTSGGRRIDAGAAADVEPGAIAPGSESMRMINVSADDTRPDMDTTSTPTGLKPVVGVYIFDDQNGSGQAAALADSIETAVIATGKFQVFDREKLFALMAEQGHDSGPAGALTMRPVSDIEGLNYLIRGRISLIAAADQSSTEQALLQVLAGRCRNNRISLSADIIASNATTGETAYADSILRVGETRCSSSEEIDIVGLLRSSAAEIVTDFATTIFPITVTEIQSDDTITLNYGAPILKVGDFLAVEGRATEIEIEGRKIEILGEKIGIYRVIDVKDSISYAQPYTKRKYIPVVVGAIARPADRGAVEDQNGRAARKK